MKRKITLIISIVCILAIGISAAVYATRDMSMFQWGQDSAEIEAEDNMQKNVVAEVNGQKITSSQFDKYKAGLSNANGTFTDAEIMDKLVRQEVLKQEIQRLGYTATEAEVTAFNDERFALLDDDPNARQIIQDYVDGLGITMAEYKEQSKEISRTALLANKFRADLMAEYEKNNPQILTYSVPTKQQGFEEYLEQYIDDLYKTADIVISE